MASGAETCNTFILLRKMATGRAWLGQTVSNLLNRKSNREPAGLLVQAKPGGADGSERFSSADGITRAQRDDSSASWFCMVIWLA